MAKKYLVFGALVVLLLPLVFSQDGWEDFSGDNGSGTVSEGDSFDRAL